MFDLFEDCSTCQKTSYGFNDRQQPGPKPPAFGPGMGPGQGFGPGPGQKFPIPYYGYGKNNPYFPYFCPNCYGYGFFPWSLIFGLGPYTRE